jgi:hypothetical protein
MSDANRKPQKRLWIILAIVLVVLLGLLGGWWLQSSRLEQARLANMPPFVFLSSPQQGDRFQAGQMVFVDASARGSRLVRTLELLVDGELIASDESPNEGGSTVRYGHFSFLIEEGVHIIHVRATDVEGTVGLSVPLGIEARPELEGERLAVIRYGPETTVEGLAEMAGLSPDELHAYNPDLVEGGMPGGGMAVVPGTADDDDGQEGGEEQSTAPSVSASHGGTPPTVVGDLFPQGASDLPWAVIVPVGLPSAPVDIAASLQDCQVVVSWSVLSHDARQYRLWMDAQDGSRHLVGTYRPTDPPSERYTTTFNPPRAGRLALFVEAVNAIGAQASETVVVNVGRECAAEGDHRLQFETIAVETDPGVDRVYFYLSLDSAPEFRLPRDDSLFFTVIGGKGVIPGASGSDSLVSLSVPQSGALNLSGECWGWNGGEPQLLSAFQQQVPESAWAGFPLTVGGAACEITLKLQGLPGFQILTTFEGSGGGLPAPYDLGYKGIPGITSASLWSSFARAIRDLSWKWDGNAQDISGFTIYLNGQPLMKVQGANQRTARILLPSDCGPHPTFHIVANGVQGDSASSPVVTIYQSPCTQYARVEFTHLHLKWTCDGYCSGSKSAYCRRLEAYYRFSVNGVTRRFYSSNFVRYMWCGNYPITDLMSPEDAIFLVPIGSEIDPATQPFEVVIDTEFWDQDDWFGDDSFGHHQNKHGFNSHNHAVGWFNSECGNVYKNGRVWFGCPPSYDDQFLYTYDIAISGTAHSDLTYYLSVYPNAVKDNP